MEEPTVSPFAQPVYLMAKPAGPSCNLRCSYCYYTDKDALYPGDTRHTMSDETLETYIRKYIEAQSMPCVQFTWHGGEATLRPLQFFRRAMELQRKYAAGRHIENSLQTNGTLLNSEWCRFLHDNNWLVGISIDGPERFHDRYRRNTAGKPTHREVMKAIRLLQRHNVEWNAMAVVNDYNAGHPEEFYEFFNNIGCRYLQFTPIVERLTTQGRIASRDEPGTEAGFSVRASEWGEFLCRVFDRWVRRDVGRIFVQLFDATLANRVGVVPGVCTMARTCGHAGVMEFNGDVYSCDHFVFPDYKLGNIHTHSVVEMLLSPTQQQFGAAKQASLTAECRRCPYLHLCNGECPKNRTSISADGEAGHPALCAGYRRFFAHTAPYFDFMASELAAGRPPANVMRFRPGK